MFELVKKIPVVSILLAAGGVAIGAGAAELSPEQVTSLFSETANNQIAQAGFFFLMASWIHSGRVKKEIKSNFSSLTLAINSVADAFREDLKKHGERLDNLSLQLKEHIDGHSK